MRVLYFHQHFTTPDGSGGTRSYEMARALIARGHQVTMVCGSPSFAKVDVPEIRGKGYHRGIIDGIDVIVLPLPYSNKDSIAKRTLLFTRFALRSVGLALREPYDLLFATSTPITAGVPGTVMKLLGRRKPFVFEVRDLWPELPRALGMRNPILLGGMSILEWLSYRCADAAVGLAPGIVESIRGRSKPGLPISMIPNGCDLDLFNPGLKGTFRIPGTTPGDFIAGFTGAHGIANGLDAVLDAAAELKLRGREEIKLLFVGDGKVKDALKDRANREGLTNCLFMDPINKRDVAKLTASLDCGLMILANVPAFYYGTSPNKFFDYLSSGIPVINNYPGWLADLIRKHGCGVVAEAGNAASMADGLCAMADNRRRCQDMGKNGRALAESEFRRDLLTAKLTNLLESVHTAFSAKKTFVSATHNAESRVR